MGSWPWPRIIKVKCWKSCITGIAGPVDTERKGMGINRKWDTLWLWTLASPMTLTLNFRGKFLKKPYFRNVKVEYYNMVRWIFAPGTMHFRPGTTLFGPVVCLHCFNFVNIPPPKSVWNPHQKLNCGDIFKECFEDIIITLKLMTVFFK